MKTMKIGFDAKRLFNNHTGLGNYSRDLVEGLKLYQPDLELHLYHPGSVSEEFSQFSKSPYRYHSPNKAIGSYWRRKTIVKDLLKHKIDLYHGLSHELPHGIRKKNIKSVVTIHDLIVKKIPSTFNRIDRSIYTYKFKQAISQSDHVVAISESTKNDIIEIYGANEKDISVIPPSINETFYQPFNQEELDQYKQKWELPESYFICVGSVIERKNMLNVVKAYRFIPKEDRVPFIVVGRGNRYLAEVKQTVQEAGLEELFDFRENVSSQDALKAHIQAAQAMVYPSIYEGFGIPCVEALCLSTPVITSNVSSLPEAAGPGAFLINPHQPEDIATAMRAVLRAEDLNERVEQGIIYSKRYSQESVASQMANLYRELLK